MPPLGLQGYKKSHRVRLDDHFNKANRDFLDAMLGESEKYVCHDLELLAWDKEKHYVLAGFELRKHREHMAQ